jgi:hypothetical protein
VSYGWPHHPVFCLTMESFWRHLWMLISLVLLGFGTEGEFKVSWCIKLKWRWSFFFLSVMEGKSFAWNRERKKVHKNFHCHISRKMTFYILSSPTYDDKVVFFIERVSELQFLQSYFNSCFSAKSGILSTSCNLSHWKFVVAEIYRLLF